MPENHSNFGIPRIIKREMELKKKKKEEEETQEIFREFVDSFEEKTNHGISRSWVRGGVVNVEESSHKSDEKDRIYQPKIVRSISPRFTENKKSETREESFSEKRKITMESFNDELLRSQQSQKIKKNQKNFTKSRFDNTTHVVDRNKSAFDKTTTIIFQNSEKITENEVMDLFGQFGRLASVEITFKSEHVGEMASVVFMNRLDAERAFDFLQGVDIRGSKLELKWGRLQSLPSSPIYTPQHLVDGTTPPPQSGLSFNAQRKGKDLYVRVRIPTDLRKLWLIHRMVEFVIREGPQFELAVMGRERNNPDFSFLYDNESQDHVYYRWKLFSLLQGDGFYNWKSSEFVMFKDGATWVPPTPPNYGAKDLLTPEIDLSRILRRDQLPEEDLKRFQDLLEACTSSRTSVGKVMCWCIEHAEYARDIVRVIVSSFEGVDPQQTIARIYLVSDILYNSGSKVAKASYYRQQFETELEKVARLLHGVYSSIPPSLRAEKFKLKIMRCFRAWDDWSIYSNEFLIRLHNIFLDIVPELRQEEPAHEVEDEMDIDGEPLEDENIFLALGEDRPESYYDEDIDGESMPDDFDYSVFDDADECT